MIHVLDDGVCALTYYTTNGAVLMRDHGEPVSIAGVVCHVGPKVCRLLGFEDYMSLRQMCLLAQLLRQLGYESAYRRNDINHRPWGEVVTYGFWKGEVHIDVRTLPTCAP